MSCSSDQGSNGCQACGLGLGLASISSSATEPADPEDPECPTFLGITRTHNSSSSTRGIYDPACEYGLGGTQSYAGTSSFYMDNTVIKEGEDLTTTVFTVMGNSSTSSKSSTWGAYGPCNDPENPPTFLIDSNGSSFIRGTVITKTDNCGNIEEYTNDIVASTQTSYSCSNTNYAPGYGTCCELAGDPCTAEAFPSCQCDASVSSTSDTFTFFETNGGGQCCDNYTSDSTSGCSGSQTIARGSCNDCIYGCGAISCDSDLPPGSNNGNLESKITYTHPVVPKAPLSRDSLISKDLNEQRTNRYGCKPAPKNCCKCGGAEGDKDSCWGSFSDFVPPDVAFQGKPRRVDELRVIVDKIMFDEGEYKSISGKVYFYFGGGGETPCCQDCGGPECFSGTIVDDKPYSISAGNTMRIDDTLYYYLDIGNLDSSSLQAYAEESIDACVTIDNISFI
jgi:hypothetical protein